MGYFNVSYVLEEQVEFETFSREEFEEMIKKDIETGKLHHEKKWTDFGDYKVYILNNGLISINETDEENPRLTILSKPPKVCALEGRIGSISESDFDRTEKKIREMYGERNQLPNGDFGQYFCWDNLTDAERCIIEHDRIKRITFYARDKDNFKNLKRRLGIQS